MTEEKKTKIKFMENFRLYNNYKTSAVYMADYILKMNTSCWRTNKCFAIKL